ncbi:DUF6499 domain-containing protein (plasmid) [Bradyrhizobium sp. 62B]|uniref:transcriptional regulator domain-containing protein n=1 Tax=Bradyrhizobium sp. 62B TaxID=2898442 RepID=UPI0025583A7E|nr:DUF6499 domain-containing protein [Bradyrhizobium sp. 62B]
MAQVDWRSPDSYDYLKNADPTEIAWEFLRRNPEYQRDYQAMIAKTPTGVTEEFRRKWGICFRP